MRTLEQHRAKYALDRVKTWLGEDGEPRQNASDYARHVRKLPTMVLNNGLGQAIAFLLADAGPKAGGSSATLYRDLEAWLSGGTDQMRPMRVYVDETPDLITQLMAGDRAQYVRAQEEVLSLLVWMKKFADAYLPKGGD
jgi:CRISPR-associated protein Cmr5